jgi:hydroxyacid-oxoacid transhydrogenase
MTCFAGYALAAGCEQAFTIDANAVTFGPGVLGECGALVASLGCRRVALFTDARLRASAHVATVIDSLRAAEFAREGGFDGYVSVGGGSVIDTCKAAALYATYPAPFAAYVNAPLGEGRAVPGPLPPHVACPTTTGTGSECTGIAIFDWVAEKKKTGIASRRLRPTHALVDPDCALTLPAMVVAASGFDVLSHAIESYTARPYTARAKPQSPSLRLMSQGRNPWSDDGAMRALQSCGKHLARAVADAHDVEARHAMAWAATLAGMAFGNAGVHLPHAMSYAVAGLAHDHPRGRDFRCDGYPDAPLVPHGLSVIVNAPSVFRALAATSPARHLEAAAAIGADTRGAANDDAGEILATALIALMKSCGAPSGIGAVGYDARDVEALAAAAFAQRRLVDNAPAPVDEARLADLFRAALNYW